MIFTAYKRFDLEPIGDIKFKFDKKGRKPKGKVIMVTDVDILPMRMKIDSATQCSLMTMMKEKGSDLLTDGRKFYTTFDGEIGEIDHPQFHKELELHNELYV